MKLPSNIAVVLAAILLSTTRVGAQISVGVPGVGPLTFDASPSSNDWTTLSVVPSSAASIITGAGLDAAVQTNTAASINAVLGTNSIIPPSPLATAQWNSTGYYLQTRPVGNSATLLMATLRNDTGSDASDVTVSYTLGALVAAGSGILEQVPGHRAYYSLTGTTGSWVHIPEFDSASPSNAGPRSAILNLLLWPSASNLFLLWADDNGSASATAPNEEGGYTMDNFSVATMPANPIAHIVVPPQGQLISPGSPVSFQVTAGGMNPLFYQWRKNSNALAGATNSSFTIPSAQAGDAGFYSVLVSNALGVAISADALLTVSCAAPVSITTQPQSQSLASGVTLTLAVAATGTPALSYQWSRSGALIPGATNQTYVKAGVTTDDSGTYQVAVANCAGPQTSAPAYVGVAAPTYALIGLTNYFWKYDQSGNDLGTAWREVNYNDALWPSGRGVLAREDNAAVASLTNTVLSLTNPLGQPVVTSYFRTHFTLTNELEGISLVASNLMDDGAVVYLNGSEIYRINMPAGNITAAHLASAASAEGVYVLTSFPADKLVPGDNVLAVEVHQTSLTSADVVFGLHLNATFPAPTPLQITSQPADALLQEGGAVTFSVGASGIGARYQWFKNGVALPNARQSTLTVSNATAAAAGYYSVAVTNAINAVFSRLARLEVVVDLLPPALLSADLLDATHILVAFSEPLPAAAANNPASYSLTNTLGAALSIVSAVLTNGTNVLLTVAPMGAGANHILTAQVADTSAQHNMALVSAPVARTFTLLPWESAWFYYDPYPPFDSADPGPDWKDDGYDTSWWGYDSAGFVWSSDNSLIEPVPAHTALGATPAFTTYFRSAFAAALSPAGLTLTLRHTVDDGAVFYLNGTEVQRFNLPAGPINTNTPSSVATYPTIRGSVALPANAFRSGPNLLAVELHQTAVNDVDKFFALELTARAESLPVGPVVLLGGPSNTTVVDRGTATFTLRALGALTFQWQLNGTNLPGATNATLTFSQTPAAWNGSLVRVRCTGLNGTVTSSNALLTVLHDTTPPVLRSARAVENGTFVLAFSEALDAAYATNLANYSVTNATGATIAVTSATLTNSTNVVLTLASFPTGNPVIVVSNLRDASADANVLSPNPSAWRPGFDLFIPIDAAWRYHQSGGDLGTAWKNVAYDDSAVGWSNGLALLYVETAALPALKNTPLSLTGTNGQSIITYYFRHAFVSPITQSNVVFTLRHVIDDGAVVYLNGVEVHRFNMAAGVPLFSSQASVNVGDAVFQGPYQFTNSLAGGTNVLAVEVHQQGVNSADVTFGAELSFTIPGAQVAFAPPPAPHLELIQFPGLLLLNWSEPGCTLEGAGAVSGPWTPLGTSPPFLISATNSAAFYRLRR